MKFLANIQSHEIRHSQDLSEFEDQMVEVTVKKLGKKRSAQQNAYYWSLVVPMLSDGLRDAGHHITVGKIEVDFDDENTHNLVVKGMFLPKYKAKSTTELSTTDWESLMKDLRFFASQKLEVYVPVPNEGDNIYEMVNTYTKERKKNNNF